MNEKGSPLKLNAKLLQKYHISITHVLTVETGSYDEHFK